MAGRDEVKRKSGVRDKPGSRCGRRLVCRFRGDRRGAVLPLVAIVLVFLIVVAGAGLDFARAINQKQGISQSLDAAMLAVARELSVRNMSTAEIKAYLDSNYAAYFGANAAGSLIPGVEVVVDEPVVDTLARRVQVSASSSVPTYFIGLAGLGPDKLEVAVSAQAIYPKSIEAALVVDVTGSMGGSKIEALQDAAAGFVNTLIPPETAGSNEKMRIALVPYATGVNIGNTRASLATAGANASRSSYPYCVSERTGIEAATDASYTTAPVGPGTNQYSYKRGRFVRWDGSLTYSSSYICPNSALVPLTRDPGSASRSGTLLYEIANLQARGNTAGQTGIAWGWYTLSDNWSSLWPTGSKPASYSDQRVLKYLVIMTDGNFNTVFGPRKVNWTNYDWIAQSSDASDDRAQALCTAIKASGIKVITVGFQIASGSSADKLMRACASSAADYYKADSNAALIAEFAKIANQIKSTFLIR